MPAYFLRKVGSSPQWMGTFLRHHIATVIRDDILNGMNIPNAFKPTCDMADEYPPSCRGEQNSMMRMIFVVAIGRLIERAAIWGRGARMRPDFNKRRAAISPKNPAVPRLDEPSSPLSIGRSHRGPIKTLLWEQLWERIWRRSLSN